jgi:pSer/pThr/pTyr-binding forkhead associated (FHA) protein
MFYPRLRLHFGEFDLPLGATTIGRAPDCHLTLDDPLVCGHHARILVGSDRTVVEDLGSRDGILVNGIRVRGPTPLRDGDRLTVGTQHMVFHHTWPPSEKSHEQVEESTPALPR